MLLQGILRVSARLALLAAIQHPAQPLKPLLVVPNATLLKGS
jgi:hypothetical protein